MGGAPLLLALAAVTIDYGYQPDGAGGLEYIVQIHPDHVAMLTEAGNPIECPIEPAIQGYVSRLVIQLGTGTLPKNDGGVLSKPRPGLTDPLSSRSSAAISPGVGDLADHRPMPIPSLIDGMQGIVPATSVQRPQSDANSSSAMILPGGSSSDARTRDSGNRLVDNGLRGTDNLAIPSGNSGQQPITPANSGLRDTFNQVKDQATQVAQNAASRLGMALPATNDNSMNSGSLYNNPISPAQIVPSTTSNGLSSNPLATTPPATFASQNSAPPSFGNPITPSSGLPSADANGFPAQNNSFTNGSNADFSTTNAPNYNQRDDTKWKADAGRRFPSTDPYATDQYATGSPNSATVTNNGTYTNTTTPSYGQNTSGFSNNYPSLGTDPLAANGYNQPANQPLPGSFAPGYTRERDYSSNTNVSNGGINPATQYGQNGFDPNRTTNGYPTAANGYGQYGASDPRNAAVGYANQNSANVWGPTAVTPLPNLSLAANSSNPSSFSDRVIPGATTSPLGVGDSYGQNSYANTLPNANSGSTILPGQTTTTNNGQYRYAGQTGRTGYDSVDPLRAGPNQPFSQKMLNGLLLFSLIGNAYMGIAVGRVINRYRDLAASIRGTVNV